MNRLARIAASAALLLAALTAPAGEPEQQLAAAVRAGDPAGVARLLKAGADPDVEVSTRLTPLVIAFTYCDHDVIKAFADNGVKFKTFEWNGWTALDLALANRFYPAPTIKLLLDQGAEALVSNREDRSLLFTAAAMSNVEVVQFAAQADTIEKLHLLVKAGSDVNRRDSEGWTPLALAAFMWKVGDARAVEGASHVEQRSSAWLKFAASHDPCDAVRVLTDAGATRHAGPDAIDAIDVAARRADAAREPLIKVLRGIKVRQPEPAK
jgi:hypothetical protein